MAAASVWLQLQVPPHRLHSPPLLSLPSNHSSAACPPVYKNKKHAAAGRGNLLLCSASGASSSVVIKEQEGAASDPSSEEGSPEPEIYSYKDDPNFRGCKGCGRDELERGCNGEGRIQGGIAAVPGFGLWLVAHQGLPAVPRLRGVRRPLPAPGPKHGRRCIRQGKEETLSLQKQKSDK